MVCLNCCSTTELTLERQKYKNIRTYSICTKWNFNSFKLFVGKCNIKECVLSINFLKDLINRFIRKIHKKKLLTYFSSLTFSSVLFGLPLPLFSVSVALWTFKFVFIALLFCEWRRVDSDYFLLPSSFLPPFSQFTGWAVDSLLLTWKNLIWITCPFFWFYVLTYFHPNTVF